MISLTLVRRMKARPSIVFDAFTTPCYASWPYRHRIPATSAEGVSGALPDASGLPKGNGGPPQALRDSRSLRDRGDRWAGTSSAAEAAGSGDQPYDRTACGRLDLHIEGHQGPARGGLRGLPGPDRSRRLAPSGGNEGRDPLDARVGDGYRTSLFHPPAERVFRGKTSDGEDMVNVRFVELAAPCRIVEAVSFVTTDPAFFGEMTLMATFQEMAGGTEVTLVFKNLPPGLRAEDNEAGSRLSLEQLARRFE